MRSVQLFYCDYFYTCQYFNFIVIHIFYMQSTWETDISPFGKSLVEKSSDSHMRREAF